MAWHPQPPPWFVLDHQGRAPPPVPVASRPFGSDREWAAATAEVLGGRGDKGDVDISDPSSLAQSLIHKSRLLLEALCVSSVDGPSSELVQSLLGDVDRAAAQIHQCLAALRTSEATSSTVDALVEKNGLQEEGCLQPW
uniref:Uncharacterized protein n=1 Tax=Rhizochromulina marina TaxID=1034831 RepID=A0A7S2SEW4_9STRA|mmetsp:Transcript_29150/g.85083  ORF Transcript_29150/g.85083 Transcript_29150/m.85083 type:complete len:139 (+) Transcript_29150:126-542(+)